MEDINEALENIATNYKYLEESNAYIKQRITDFYKPNKIKIDFNNCDIAFSKNGGLIAICKHKTFLDTSKNPRFNKYIIVMFQNSKNIYEIPIDWDFNKRWIICLDFTPLQELYGILNDGGIFKFKYNERTKKEKITCMKLKEEGVKKAKFYKRGFIAYTNSENFYYIKNIKEPSSIFICNVGILTLSQEMDFLIIPEETSKSNKIELLILNENGNGVVHIEQKIKEENFQLTITEEKTTEVIGVDLILKGRLQPFILNNLNQREKKCEEISDGFNNICAISISPSGNKIAFYNKELRTAFIINSDFSGNYSKVLFKINNEEYSQQEQNELNAILLEFKPGNQFLFCGEDVLAIYGQRFIILSRPNIKYSLTYLIKEGGEMLAMQGVSFCKCISEIDGIRCLTNDGVYLINEVPKELYDITFPFSSSKTKNLIQIYKNSFSTKYNSIRHIKALQNLSAIVSNLQIASANIFWTNTENEENNKEVQLFLLKSAQFGKNFVEKSDFNFDKFNSICYNMRIINQIRNDEKYPLFITYREFCAMNPKDIIEILLRYKNFKSASQISKYLEYDTKKIMYKYMIEKMKSQIKIAEKYRFSSIKSKEYENEEEKIYQNLLDDIERLQEISYVKMAKKSIQFGSEKLAMKLLEQEKSALTKIPQLLELNKLINSLNICFETFDFNILSIVLNKISKKKINSKSEEEILFFENLCKPELIKHHSKIILFLKKYKPEKLEFFLLKTKNYDEYLFMKLEKLFNCQTSDEKISIIKELKKEIKNFDSKYKYYIDNLENSINFKKSCIEENIIHYTDKMPYNKTVYDCIFKGTKKEKFNLIEGQIKNLDFSYRKAYIIRFRSYLEMNRPDAIDSQLEKTSLKKLGLTPMDMGEIYYDYKFYNKAAEYLLQVKENAYFPYIIDLLRSIGKNKEALEVVMAAKELENKKILVNEIILKEPELKNYVNELCVKYKISLE